jgi:hypothetical protein
MKSTQRYGASILIAEKALGGFLAYTEFRDAVGRGLRLFLRDRGGIRQ